MSVTASATPPNPEPAAPARCEIEFRAGGRGHEFLIAGWSFPETEYTWTLGRKSIIRVPLGPRAGDYALRFKLGPMLREGSVTYQRVGVEANGTMVASLVCRGTAQYELLLPEAVIGRDGAVEIVFHLPDAQPPSALGSSGDTRELGVWLGSLHLQPLMPNPAAGQAGPDASDKAMLMEVQSLGENCELGFVQRAGGAEPFGLFRWAATPLPNLLRALEARFDGIGQPGSLEIEVDSASEFQVHDRRFGFRNHSFSFANAGARKEDILKRELVRLPFLARLMVEELESASKLFCFHDAGRSGRAQIDTLVAALGRYGPNTLLWVCRAEAPAQVGTAERLHAHLLRGYIDTFQPLHDVRKPSLDAWMAVLRAAHRLWKG